MPRPPKIKVSDLGHQIWNPERRDGPCEIWHYPGQPATGVHWELDGGLEHRVITLPAGEAWDMDHVFFWEDGKERRPFVA